MRKWMFFLVLLQFVLLRQVSGQSIARYEYFFDSDPGNGHGISMGVTIADSVTINTTINSSPLASGMHLLGIRSINTDSIWGLTEFRNFFIVQPPDTNGQQIARFEYFFDTDPGEGSGAPIIVSTADSATITQVVSANSLSNGMHVLGVRTLYQNGVWGHTEFRNFFVVAPTSQASTQLTRFEYFFDADPGEGLANPLILSASDSVSINQNVSAGSLGNGMHVLGIRAFNQNGKWSHTEFRNLFLISPVDTTNQQIVAGEFYLDTPVPAQGSGTPIQIANASDSISIQFNDSLQNLSIGPHLLHIRFKNAKGIWSHQVTDPFTICNTYGPVSDMSYHIEGDKVFFTNNSTNADSVVWKFGDNSTDTVRSPIKTYASAGVYNVDLITRNGCGADTLSTAIEIRGLQNVNASLTGNGGVTTLLFSGFGFTSSTNVELIQGAQLIMPAFKTFLNSNRILASFDLTGAPPGSYRAIATLGGAFDTLSNALVIENNIPAKITLSFGSGRQLTRPGRIRNLFTVENSGSHDAIMVPVISAVNYAPNLTSANRNFSLVTTDMVFLQTQGIFQQTYQYLANNNVPAEVMSVNDLDTARQKHLIAFYKVRIPGHSSINELTQISNSTSLVAFQAAAKVMPPLMDSYALLGAVNSEYEACYSSFLKHEVQKQLNISINAANWSNCFATAYDTLMKTFVHISQDPTFNNFGVPMQAAFSALLASMANCPASGVPANLGGVQFKRIIQGVVNNWVYFTDIDSLDNDCIDTTIHFTQARMNANPISINSRTEAGGACSDCPGAAIFPEMCDQCLPILQAGKIGKKLKLSLGRSVGTNSAVVGCKEWCENNSIDPNAKYGPGNNNDKKYINHLKDVGYTITFENVATATAPAAFVEVTDTLDKSVFDMNKLQIGAISWGDSLVVVEPNKKDVSYLKDLRPAHPNYLRIDVTSDTASGAVRWRFSTVDTIKYQLTTDPTQGFLPPNTDTVSGAGFVSFIIGPNSSVTNGTILKNKATIVFDQNTPITTGQWEHRIDTLKPSSAVNSLPPVTNSTNFNVSWSGSDAHSGIDRFTIYVSVNDSNYKVWKSLTTQTSDTYNGQFGNTYKFISIALDKAGNFEDPPADAIHNPDAVTSVQIALPLNLLSFTANKTSDNKRVQLEWVTTNEQNVSRYEIQRSANGFEYKTITTVPALNLISGAIYDRVDANPLSKINYYRLKMIDIDGSFKYSPVRLIRFNETDPVLVFPTVTSDVVFIQSGKEITAELINVMGVVLQTQIVRTSSTFDLTKYAPGIYYIRIPSLDKTFKIVRQ